MTTGGYLTQTTASMACFRTLRLKSGCTAGLPENIERSLSMSIYQDTTDFPSPILSNRNFGGTFHHPFCLLDLIKHTTMAKITVQHTEVTIVGAKEEKGLLGREK